MKTTWALGGPVGSLTRNCDGGAGSAAIPGSILGLLPSGTGYELSASTASEASSKHITIGDWALALPSPLP